MKTDPRDLPPWLRLRLAKLRLWKGVDWAKAYLTDERFVTEDERCLTTIIPGAEAVSSQWRDIGDGYDHMILIDLDVEAVLVPSTSVGHHHLYIDAEVRFEDYLDMLRAMQKCGIVEEGYVKATEQRGEAFLRLPWVRKGLEEADAREALENWLDGDEEGS